MLDDVTSDNEGSVYISDTEDANKIHKYSNGTISDWYTEGLNGPNGLLTDGERLLVASQGSGDFAEINIKSGMRKLLADSINRETEFMKGIIKDVKKA